MEIQGEPQMDTDIRGHVWLRPGFSNILIPHPVRENLRRSVASFQSLCDPRRSQ